MYSRWFATVFLLQFSLCFADKEILKLFVNCPLTSFGKPVFTLRTDVNGHAQAKCRNGLKMFTPDSDGIEHTLVGNFDQSYVGEDCLVYKKNGVNTFTVEIEYGMGDKMAEGIFSQYIKTVSCVYDEYGNVITSLEKIGDAVLAAKELQDLTGPEADVEFDLKVMDVLDETIVNEKIDIGRKIRLYITEASGSLIGFRAISCFAENGMFTYPILVAGCGDGLVIPQDLGFSTKGNQVHSPYFKAFRLRGTEQLGFRCNFAVCRSNCDGDSCSNEMRQKRSVDDRSSVSNITVISAKSESILVEGNSVDSVGTDLILNEWNEKSPIKQLQPIAQVTEPESFLDLPVIAGMVLVFMCLIATILTVYFVLTTPRSSFQTICSANP